MRSYKILNHKRIPHGLRCHLSASSEFRHGTCYQCQLAVKLEDRRSKIQTDAQMQVGTTNCRPSNSQNHILGLGNIRNWGIHHSYIAITEPGQCAHSLSIGPVSVLRLDCCLNFAEILGFNLPLVSKSEKFRGGTYILNYVRCCLHWVFS